MELFQVEITGFKKFKEKSTIKTRGKVIAILGPNEAGKSSLLRALHLLDTNEAYAVNERSRGTTTSSPVVKATYLLSDEDRKEANLEIGTWYEITKYPNGERKWNIRPTPPDRDYSHRTKLASKIRKIPRNAVKALAEFDEKLYNESLTQINELYKNQNEITDSAKNDLKEIVDRWHEAAKSVNFSRVTQFHDLLLSALEIETKESNRLKAGSILWSRTPEFVLFGHEDRDLKASYDFGELSTKIPRALANLSTVAELDLPKLISIATSDPNDPEFDTMMEQANLALQKNFQAAWKQSKVSVVLAHREERLLIQVYNNDRSRTDFAQRSDGLRQFVALRCFTASRNTDDFVLLIDEVEQHLHYDAQADLVQMLAGQTVASKVIYSTHSLGCLPEDLGNGVRLVTPSKRDSDWSKIENKFWGVSP